MNQREFLYLCARGTQEEVEEAIINGASVNRPAKYQGVLVPPLFVAVMEKNYEAIYALILHKAKCLPAFIAAIFMENIGLLSYLVIDCEADVNCSDKHKRTPLLCAVISNKVDIVKHLIRLGADVNQKTSHDCNVLTHFALMVDSAKSNKEYNPKIIKILIRAGIDYSQAMLVAIRTNNLKLAKLLLRNGANVNKICSNDQRPLTLAILDIQNIGDKALPMIELLIEYGANVDEVLDLQMTENDETQFFYTTNLNLAISVASNECAEILLRNGADPNFIDFKGRTPLMYAIFTSYSLLDTLLAYGADPNIRDFDGRTSLTLAVIDIDLDSGVIEALLKNGADPNIQDNLGLTPLMWAVNSLDRTQGFFIAALIRTGAFRSEQFAECLALSTLFSSLSREIQIDTVRTLIRYGANVNISDNKGLNPLMSAILNDDEEIANILIEAGAKKFLD